MTLRRIPSKPDDNLLPGLRFKTKERREYEKAFWPAFRQDQHLLMSCEELAPPHDLYEFGGRVWNMSRVKEWNRDTLRAFYRAVKKAGTIEDRPGAFYAATKGREAYQDVFSLFL